MFKHIKPEDYSELRCFFEEQRYGLCAYSLASILAWNNCVHDVSFKLVDDLLLIAEKDIAAPHERRLLMPLAKNGREIAPEELAARALQNGFQKCSYVPEDYLERALAQISGHFKAVEEPGFMDYIYNASDLAELKGHKYAKKRNLLAQFAKQTEAVKKTAAETLTPENSGLCLEMLERWTHDPETGKNLDMLNCERKAIKNSLENFGPYEMKGTLVKIDGEITGFAFGARLSRDTFALQFEKALESVKGLYQFLDREFARSLAGEFAFINKENDLGKPGLAKAKQSYYPVKKIKSYTLELK